MAIADFLRELQEPGSVRSRGDARELAEEERRRAQRLADRTLRNKLISSGQIQPAGEGLISMSPEGLVTIGDEGRRSPLSFKRTPPAPAKPATRKSPQEEAELKVVTTFLKNLEIGLPPSPELLTLMRPIAKKFKIDLSAFDAKDKPPKSKNFLQNLGKAITTSIGNIGRKQGPQPAAAAQAKKPTSPAAKTDPKADKEFRVLFQKANQAERAFIDKLPGTNAEKVAEIKRLIEKGKKK